MDAATPHLSNVAREKRKVLHDLRAQSLNIHGFCGELEFSAQSICSVLSNQRQSEQNNQTDSLEKLIVDDLLPCIAYLRKSANQLDSVIAEVDQLYGRRMGQ